MVSSGQKLSELLEKKKNYYKSMRPRESIGGFDFWQLPAQLWYGLQIKFFIFKGKKILRKQLES